MVELLYYGSTGISQQKIRCGIPYNFRSISLWTGNKEGIEKSKKRSKHRQRVRQSEHHRIMLAFDLNLRPLSRVEAFFLSLFFIYWYNRAACTCALPVTLCTCS